MAYTEIHFHLLPGVDDGPTTVTGTVELARAAAADGTDTIIATPHVNLDNGLDIPALAATFAEARAAIEAAGVPVTVHLGGEISHHRVSSLSDADLETISNGPPGARWVLLEAALDGLDTAFSAAADRLRARGYGVVMAHPERSLGSSPPSAWQVLERELRAGTAVQVNAWSLAGRYGTGIRDLAFRVLAAAPGAAVASDAHGPARPPSLTLARATLEAAGDRFGARRMEAVTRELLEHGVPLRAPAAA